MLSQSTPDFGFGEIARLRADLERLVNGRGQRSLPVNVYAKDDEVLVTTEIPGMRSDQIELSVENDELVIDARCSLPEDVRWLRRERPIVDHARVVQLPFRANPEAVEAYVKNGVLEVLLRRPEEDKPKRIAINAN